MSLLEPMPRAKRLSLKRFALSPASNPRAPPASATPSSMVAEASWSMATSGRHLQFYYAPERKKLALDSVIQTSTSDYLEVARVVWFGNADIDLVRGPADLRRRFLDFLGAQINPATARPSAPTSGLSAHATTCSKPPVPPGARSRHSMSLSSSMAPRSPRLVPLSFSTWSLMPPPLTRPSALTPRLSILFTKKAPAKTSCRPRIRTRHGHPPPPNRHGSAS